MFAFLLTNAQLADNPMFVTIIRIHWIHRRKSEKNNLRTCFFAVNLRAFHCFDGFRDTIIFETAS